MENQIKKLIQKTTLQLDTIQSIKEPTSEQLVKHEAIARFLKGFITDLKIILNHGKEETGEDTSTTPKNTSKS